VLSRLVSLQARRVHAPLIGDGQALVKGNRTSVPSYHATARVGATPSHEPGTLPSPTGNMKEPGAYPISSSGDINPTPGSRWCTSLRGGASRMRQPRGGRNGRQQRPSRNPPPDRGSGMLGCDANRDVLLRCSSLQSELAWVAQVAVAEAIQETKAGNAVEPRGAARYGQGKWEENGDRALR
jgi:hypothetical protein